MSNDLFIPTFEEMNLSALYDKTFAVAVATGDPSGQMYLPTTLRGPFNFDDMVNEVMSIWRELDNAKVILLEKDRSKRFITLDPVTVEYIQMRGEDILIERIFGISADKKFTCEAGITAEEVEKDGS